MVVGVRRSRRCWPSAPTVNEHVDDVVVIFWQAHIMRDTAPSPSLDMHEHNKIWYGSLFDDSVPFLSKLEIPLVV